jgi:F-type H+-transporting ATPase subunit delta
VARSADLVEGYARALFAVAQAEGALEDVEDELFRFARSLETQPRLRDALTDPALPVERKEAVLDDVLGDRANRHTVGLLRFLVQQGRVRDLVRIAERLVALAAEQRRLAVAEVRTAVPIDRERQERLAAALSKATGRDVTVKVLIDPSVVGGVVARVGDQVFDGSIRGRFEDIRQQLGSV